MSKVLILMGSQNDSPVMEESEKYLKWFGIDSDMYVASAHRDPEKVVALVTKARSNGYVAVIAGAGMAAALPGVVSAHTDLPVMGVPLASGLPGGIDALYSIVQMPPGLPVGCFAVGKAGARNAAIQCARVIGITDAKMVEKLNEFKSLGYKL